MVNRLILGRHAGQHKFRISKQGIDVLTADENGLMLTDQVASRALYKVFSGSVIVNGTSFVNVSHPNFGQIPMVYYRASPTTADDEYNYIVYNFQITTRALTSFRIYNDNAANQRVYYYLWVA